MSEENNVNSSENTAVESNAQELDGVVDAVEETVAEPVSTAEKSEEKETPSQGKWYILQTYSGHEYKVQARIFDLIEKKKLQDKVFQVLIPEEETVEIKNNKRLEKTTRIYPGYVFVLMNMDDQVYFDLRSLPSVSQFIGSKTEPTPVTEEEILRVLRKVGDSAPKIDVDFEIEEVIKVISGPFRGYAGAISEINAEKGTLKAMISIFGRETPVKLDFDQVEKVVES